MLLHKHLECERLSCAVNNWFNQKPVIPLDSATTGKSQIPLFLRAGAVPAGRSARRQPLLFTIDPVFKPPQLSAARLDQQKESAGIAHLIGLVLWLCIANGNVAQCHGGHFPFQMAPESGP